MERILTMRPGDKVHVIEKVTVRIDPSFGSLSNAPIFEIGPELIGTLVSIGESNTQVAFPIVPGLSFKVVVVPSNIVVVEELSMPESAASNLAAAEAVVDDRSCKPWSIEAREDFERGYNSN
jgi:hypothetical protein